jgi:hypothetical protein
MRRFATRIMVVGVTAGMLAALAPTDPAAASSGLESQVGGCSWESTHAPGSTTETFVVYEASVTLDVNKPVYATASCVMRIDGVLQLDTQSSYSGFAVQYGTDQLTITADESSLVDVCQRFQYADGYDSGWECPTYGWPPYIPPEGNPLGLVDAMNEFLTYHVDPVVCPVLAAHPGDYGAASIKPDGDVYVRDPLDLFAGAAVYDCPPYGNF